MSKYMSNSLDRNTAQWDGVISRLGHSRDRETLGKWWVPSGP
jgi:hypothetical protein